MSHRSALAGPRVVIDCGDYEFGNLGDVGMLQVAVRRLRDQLPAASLEVITRDPAALGFHCPGTVPLSYEGRQLWVERGVLLGRADRVLRRTPLFSDGGLEGALRRHSAPLLERLVRARVRRQAAEREAFGAFLTALSKADAVVVCGAGGITDHARRWATQVLALLEDAMARGAATAMFGHGLGPLTDPGLRRVASRVLPRLDLLALREARAGEPLARSLGVPPERLCITGDDAIELAYAVRPRALGRGIGVNLRVSRSAGVDESYIGPVGAVLQRFAVVRDAPLFPVPIGRGRASSDTVTLTRLLDAAADQHDGGAGLVTPAAVIAQIALCRIVITGAYHAAVFALAQGIPVVCLARSAYFSDKFLGLASQFGEGCTMIDLGAVDLPGQLEAAAERAWDTAESSRAALLEVARCQIDASRSAYGRFARLLLDRRAVRGAAPEEAAR